MKLTPKMTELLMTMAKGKRVYFAPYMGRFNPNAYYMCIGLGQRTKQAEALLARGLARRVKEDKYSNRHDLELTAEGRALAATSTTSKGKE